MYKSSCDQVLSFPGAYRQNVKIQPLQDVLQGDAAEEEASLAQLISSHTLPHQNTSAGGRGRQMARSLLLSRHARHVISHVTLPQPVLRIWVNKISHGDS